MSIPSFKYLFDQGTDRAPATWSTVDNSFCEGIYTPGKVNLEQGVGSPSIQKATKKSGIIKPKKTLITKTEKKNAEKTKKKNAKKTEKKARKKSPQKKEQRKESLKGLSKAAWDRNLQQY